MTAKSYIRIPFKKSCICHWLDIENALRDNGVKDGKIQCISIVVENATYHKVDQATIKL